MHRWRWESPVLPHPLLPEPSVPESRQEAGHLADGVTRGCGGAGPPWGQQCPLQLPQRGGGSLHGSKGLAPLVFVRPARVGIPFLELKYVSWGFPRGSCRAQGRALQPVTSLQVVPFSSHHEPQSPASPQPAPSPAVSLGNSLEILGVLGDGHVDDIQGMLVVLLGREEQGQQVEGIGVVPAHRQGLLQLLHGLGDLPRQPASSGAIP